MGASGTQPGGWGGGGGGGGGGGCVGVDVWVGVSVGGREMCGGGVGGGGGGGGGNVMCEAGRSQLRSFSSAAGISLEQYNGIPLKESNLDT